MQNMGENKKFFEKNQKYCFSIQSEQILEIETDSLETVDEKKTLATFQQLSSRSRRIGIIFPTKHNLIKNIGTNENTRLEIELNARGCRPIIHEKVVSFMNDFLELKRRSGSFQEKHLYRSGNVDSIPKFVDRLLRKRPLAFLGSRDSFMLRNGVTGADGFETIGGPKERPPLVLKDYLSYDEVSLAALIGVSVPTHFINSGSRGNRGQPEKDGTFEKSGVYTALVGARFEREDQMESKHMLVQPHLNVPEFGYGTGPVAEKIVDPLLQLWAKFYEIDKDLTDSCPGKKRKFASDSFLPEAISLPTVEAHRQEHTSSLKIAEATINPKKKQCVPAVNSILNYFKKQSLPTANSMLNFFRSPCASPSNENAKVKDLEVKNSMHTDLEVKNSMHTELTQYSPCFPTYSEVVSSGPSSRFIKTGYPGHSFLDSLVYKQRLRVTIEPFLLDANERAKSVHRKAYLHVVGLGLGVWQISPAQGKLMVEVYAKILTEQNLPHISDIDFSYFPSDCTNCNGVTDGGIFCPGNENAIRI